MVDQCYDVCPDNGLSNYDRYSDYKGSLTSLGTLTLQYSYNLNRHDAFGINAGYDILIARRYDGYTGAAKGLENVYGLVVYPEYRRTHNPDRKVKVYTSVCLGVGLGFYHNTHSSSGRYYNSTTGLYEDSEIWSMVPILQLAPVGISFGRRVFGFGELTFGTLNIGGRAGIGYKF